MEDDEVVNECNWCYVNLLVCTTVIDAADMWTQSSQCAPEEEEESSG